LRLAYPKSFFKLLLIGFALVMLPLIFAFGNAALYFDHLAAQSRKAITQAVQATRSSRVLAEQLTSMERSARQYFVLNDRLLLDSFVHTHENFSVTVHELSSLPLEQAQRHELETLSSREAALYRLVSAEPMTKSSSQAMVSEFVELSDLAQDILNASNRQTDRESETLAKSAERAQQILLWQAMALFPVAILVAVIITFLLAQPIRRMDSAIRRLGSGDYSEAIAIDGPGDLRTLGERLNWLRIQLLQLEEQKKRFLRHVSHELKTPLTAIREGSELLTDEVGGSLKPQQREIASILRENSMRLQKMIENLLNYSAVEFQKPELKLEAIALADMVNKILSECALTISRKQINIQADLAQATLIADREKLYTIMDNLLSNAIKFTPQGGSIAITVRETTESVALDVRDSGPGVGVHDREHLFDPFYHGSSPYDGRVPGSGLGLSIAKEYVELLGGNIALLSSDQGAHFRVVLPRQHQDIS